VRPIRSLGEGAGTGLPTILLGSKIGRRRIGRAGASPFRSQPPKNCRGHYRERRWRCFKGEGRNVDSYRPYGARTQSATVLNRRRFSHALTAVPLVAVCTELLIPPCQVWTLFVVPFQLHIRYIHMPPWYQAILLSRSKVHKRTP
jgi:hypothetical protein